MSNLIFDCDLFQKDQVNEREFVHTDLKVPQLFCLNISSDIEIRKGRTDD